MLHIVLISSQGFQLMRGLVTSGAGQMDELPGRLKYLEQPFESCVKNLRSPVEQLNEGETTDAPYSFPEMSGSRSR